MSSPSTCPYCGAEQPPEVDAPSGVVDCSACGKSFLASEASDRALRALPVPNSRPPSGQGDVSLASTGLLAALLTVLFYLGVVGPLGDTFFGQLFGDRGWVPYVISDLAIWSAVILFVKWRRLRAAGKRLAFELLPDELSLRITPENAELFIDRLKALPVGFDGDLLVRRMVRALEQFSIHASLGEIVDQLRGEAERAEGLIESSYAMLRVFIWAIPILGFIGTVLGIGAAVGGFSESVSAAADIDVIKDSIGAVTSGLGVAFDTTLLALVMSICIMFPTSSLQKAEEDYLVQVEDYCQDRLLSRLDSGKSQGDAVADSDWVQPLADRFVAEVLSRLDQRTGEKK